MNVVPVSDFGCRTNVGQVQHGHLSEGPRTGTSRHPDLVRPHGGTFITSVGFVGTVKRQSYVLKLLIRIWGSYAAYVSHETIYIRFMFHVHLQIPQQDGQPSTIQQMFCWHRNLNPRPSESCLCC